MVSSVVRASVSRKLCVLNIYLEYLLATTQEAVWHDSRWCCVILCCKEEGNVHRAQRLLKWISSESWIISSSNNTELNTVPTAGTVLLWLQMSLRVVKAVPKARLTYDITGIWAPRRHLIHRILSEHTDQGQVESSHLFWVSFPLYPSVWTSAHHEFTKERFFPEHDDPAVHERSEHCVSRFWSNPRRKPL